MKRVSCVFLRKPCAFYYLHLMDFQHVEWQGRYYRCLPQALAGILARQSKYDMSARQNAPFVRLLDGLPAALEGVSSVYPSQRLVIGRLYAISTITKVSLLKSER